NSVVNVGFVQNQQSQIGTKGSDRLLVQIAHKPSLSHIRSHQHNAATEQDFIPLSNRNTAINEPDFQRQRLKQAVPLCELVLNQGFGGIKHKHTSKGVAQQ